MKPPRAEEGYHEPSPTSRVLTTLALLILCFPPWANAQDLAPRAYVITPVNTNAMTLIYTLSAGNINLEGAVPITDATAAVSIPMASYLRSLNVLGRSGNFLVTVPYGVGNFKGNVFGAETNAYRSGMFPPAFRFSVNLMGGPAMDVPEFLRWRQKTLLGASVKILAPSGQYDPTRLINFGTNRWAFKPEIGLSQRWGHWILDAYGATWFFTVNPEFFSENRYRPGINRVTQTPIGAFEGHLSYDIKPRLWASVNGNFWFGGTTSLNGVPNPATTNRNSRLGATVSLPVSKRQSLKFSYSIRTYTRYGGNYQNVSAAWQYFWVTKQK